MSDYIVVTLGERIQAETAAKNLETAGLPTSQISVFGQGFKMPDTDPLFDPTLLKWQSMKRMMLWLLPFGFFAGVTFNQITQLTIVPGLGSVGDGFIGGLFGLGAAAMGSFAYGGGAQLYLDKDLVPYAKRLEKGKYLVIVKGSQRLIQDAKRVLRVLDPEIMTIYEDID
ncbi:MAG: hypothetical protein AAF329_17070 [Cyanobacteria bacterium P01_A01_bin.17]